MQAHSEHGYAVLGGIDPSSSQQVAGAQQPKLHPTRNFGIRDMYNPTVSPNAQVVHCRCLEGNVHALDHGAGS